MNFNSNGICTTSFEETPKTSSYLIAYVVSDFKVFENYAGPITKRIKHRILANENYYNNVIFPLESGENILDDLQEFVGVSYSLPKMDQIGLPDFAAGAMENWGLVTYR